MAVEKVTFDVLIKPTAPCAPGMSTIEKLRPPPSRIQYCTRWFANRGVVAHATDFGIACSADRSVFEELFSVALEVNDPAPGTPVYRISGTVTAPAEIASDIEQITLSVPPVYF